MTSNSNNFIVYLGEEVTPKEEIKKLWDSIVINTVVDQNGMNNNYTIKTNGDMYYDPNRPNKLTQDQNPLNTNNDPVTEIPLSNYIPNSDAVINSLLTSLKDGNTQTTVSSEPFDYAPYGQSKMGKIADLDTSTDGFAVKDELPILKENEAYYLVETKAPDGYIMLDHPIQVKLEIKKDYYTADKNERYIREHEGTSSPENTLYSMVERSKLTLADDPAVRRTNNDGTGDLTHAGLDYGIDIVSQIIRVLNFPLLVARAPH